MLQRFLSICLVMCWALITGAQDTTPVNAPLLAHVNQQLYILEDDALVEYDACMPDERIQGALIPSPQTDSVLMLTQPPRIRAFLDAVGTLGDTTYGLNFWICDTETNTLERVYTQPDSDDPFNDELPTLTGVESVPQWSPDATQLAWTRLNFEDQTVSLRILTLEDSTLQDIPLSIPAPEFPAPPTLEWTAQGIVMTQVTLDEETFINVEMAYVYDLEEQNIVAETVLYDGFDDYINERLLLTDRETLTYALQFGQGGWALADILSGDLTFSAGLPYLYAPAAPDGLRVAFTFDFVEFVYEWRPAVDSTPLRGYPPQRIALAPDGSAFAYADSTLHIWRDGIVTDIANSDGFADDGFASITWAALAYGFDDDTSSAPPPPSCDGAPMSQLRAGDSAQTTINLNVRADAGTDGERVGELAPETTVSVVAGPLCIDGYAWYQVETDNLTGWAAEGTDAQYFLEPLP